MDDSVYSRQEEIRDTSHGRPHVVILGAGASVAAFPSGDAGGKALPTMDNMIAVVGLASHFERVGINPSGRNFEDVYSELSEEPAHAPICLEIENLVRDYFASLFMPLEPTIYDYLVLSLREKDVIATFNWDPFLFLALKRNAHIAPAPHWMILHGCSILGFCETDKRQGELNRTCGVCAKPFDATKLLFPIKHKDYNSDPYVSTQWANLQIALQKAFTITIFGYGAPASDVEAIKLMKSAWGPVTKRTLEETEIIDILNKDVLVKRWSSFIHTHHYTIVSDFFDSFMANHPRRTCEAYWQSLLQARFYEGNPVLRTDSLDELWEWYAELISYEPEASA